MKRAVRHALGVVVATSLVWSAACGSGSGQPGHVVDRFYDAVIRGDVRAAQSCLSSQRVRDVSEVIRTATREGMLRRVELLSTDVWAEHGAVCEVRKHFIDDTNQLVRLDVRREAGDWKLASGSPSF